MIPLTPEQLIEDAESETPTQQTVTIVKILTIGKESMEGRLVSEAEDGSLTVFVTSFNGKALKEPGEQVISAEHIMGVARSEVLVDASGEAQQREDEPRQMSPEQIAKELDVLARRLIRRQAKLERFLKRQPELAAELQEHQSNVASAEQKLIDLKGKIDDAQEEFSALSSDPIDGDSDRAVTSRKKRNQRLKGLRKQLNKLHKSEKETIRSIPTLKGRVMSSEIAIKNLARDIVDLEGEIEWIQNRIARLNELPQTAQTD